MKYEKTQLNTNELQKLLKANNPKGYDHLRILFKNGYSLECSNLNYEHKYNYVLLNDDTYEYTSLKKVYFYQNQYMSLLDEALTNGGGDIEGWEKVGTYDNIKSCIVWYYNDYNNTDYTGKKEAINNVENLKQYFQDNKNIIKYNGSCLVNYGGSEIRGIGGKKVNIDGSFYSYKELWNIYTGNVVNYHVAKVLGFLFLKS